jgi:hypothetical protein
LFFKVLDKRRPSVTGLHTRRDGGAEGKCFDAEV